MRREAHYYRKATRLILALTLAMVLCLTNQSFASAQNLRDSIKVDFEPVSFDKTEIKGDEVFHAIIRGSVSCAVDLPVSVSEASLTYRVIAVHAASNMTATLSEGYTITMKPVPSKKGESTEINQVVPLQFSGKPITGDYNVVGKIVEAKAKVMFGWITITSYLPPEQPMGTVRYTAPETEPEPESPPPPEPGAGPPLLKPSPADGGAPAPAETTALPEPESPLPWWVVLIVLLAVATTLFNIVWFLRHRYR